MKNAIQEIIPLDFQWKTQDPFLFCVYHKDNYPKGNDQLGPNASLAGRHLGQDFDPHNSWRMYHGTTVPGFPQHPHRGFETVTIVPRGFVDHSDSLGAAGRFGNGDVQWMTAGKGVNHCEMFPLLNKDQENPLLLFQIWLNLPAKSKLVEPHFAMLWGEDVPVYQSEDGKTRVTIIAGEVNGVQAPPPPPDSWAATPAHELGIWTIEMQAGASWKLPAASAGVNRSLFFYEGDLLRVEDRTIPVRHGLELAPDVETVITSGNQSCRLLLLQGQPINEPVVQYGPFVMNTQAEIRTALSDYQQTGFGGWPWPENGHVHPESNGRFAKHADGRIETPK